MIRTGNLDGARFAAYLTQRCAAESPIHLHTLVRETLEPP